MPARHREILAAMQCTQLTVTKHPEGALMIFPQPEWDIFCEQLKTLPMDAMGWKRVFLGNAMDVELDSSSRLLIAPELRKAAGLVRDVMLLGLGNHFELWDAARHAEHDDRVMQSPMPECLKNVNLL